MGEKGGTTVIPPRPDDHVFSVPSTPFNGLGNRPCPPSMRSVAESTGRSDNEGGNEEDTWSEACWSEAEDEIVSPRKQKAWQKGMSKPMTPRFSDIYNQTCDKTPMTPQHTEISNLLNDLLEIQNGDNP